MSASNFSACPQSNSLPDFVNIPGIPSNISTIIVPARESSYPPMVACCAPHPVELSGGCYYWCEVPAEYASNPSERLHCLRRSNTGNTTNTGNSTNTTVGDNGITILGAHKAGANDVATGWERVVFWAVAASAVLHVVSM